MTVLKRTKKSHVASGPISGKPPPSSEIARLFLPLSLWNYLYLTYKNLWPHAHRTAFMFWEGSTFRQRNVSLPKSTCFLFITAALDFFPAWEAKNCHLVVHPKDSHWSQNVTFPSPATHPPLIQALSYFLHKKLFQVPLVPILLQP